MITAINDQIDRVLRVFLALTFAGLILVVAIQVAARNVLLVPVPWTLDIAQLFFSWCIFIGAALAFRYGQHYLVNLWPIGGRFEFVPKVAAFWHQRS